MKVAIVGGGLIGASWAALFSTVGGHEVWCWDPSPSARDALPSKIEHAQRQLQSLGAPNLGSARVCESQASALEAAQWVQENAPEKIELKVELYRQIERSIDADTIIATSTSSFTWSQLAKELTHPQRFVVAHPFNPPHLVPLVELYCPYSPILERAVAFFEQSKRVPVCLKKEAVGHIGNRLASALWREAVHIVAEGIAEVSDVDRVLIHGPGLRWSVIGTHLGYHLGGGDGGIDHYLRHLGPSQERRWASLGHPQLTSEVCEAIAHGVHAETAGRSIAQLESQRDAQLIEILRLRQAHPTVDQAGKGSAAE